MPVMEWQIQKAIFDWREKNIKKYPILEFLMGMVFENKRSPKRAGIAKSMGMPKGFPDIFLPAKNQILARWSGLAIELKRPGEKPRKEQLRWLDFLSSQGFACCVMDDAEEVIKCIKNYIDEANFYGD